MGRTAFHEEPARGQIEEGGSHLTMRVFYTSDFQGQVVLQALAENLGTKYTISRREQGRKNTGSGLKWRGKYPFSDLQSTLRQS